MDWPTARIGDYCEVIAGQSPKGKYYNDKGDGMPFYQGKKEFGSRSIGAPQKWTTAVTKEAKEGDILMSVRAPVGPVNFSTQAICIGRGLAAIRPSKEVDKEFLFYYFQSKQDEIQGNEGAVFASINKAQIENLIFPVPNLREQKRIVAILDQAFAEIDKALALTERNLKNAQDLFESFLSKTFSGIVEGQKQASLEEIVLSDCTLSYGIVQPGKEVVNGLPVVRPTDLSKKMIASDGLKRIDPKLAQSYQRTVLKGGEILLCVRGTTGVVSIAGGDLVGANVTRGIVPVRFSPDKVNQTYGYYQFLSKRIQDQIGEKTYGAALMQINIKDVKKIDFVIPPLSHQGSVIKNLGIIEASVLELSDLSERRIRKLEELRSSILQQAFSGGLGTDDQGEAA